ncbi:MAG: hydroxymethylglutaryl-CoA synthase family protein [Candidatus Altiarchaeota archaeon]|nr:hydroxymethylglutaryl-CoA synthase family protein [Candidatus Altiarchaeota archaeon]
MAGIDNLEVYVPSHYIDISESAKVFSRKKPQDLLMTEEQFIGLVSNGLGVKKKAVAMDEDATTLTMTVAERLLEKMENSDIRRIVVSSESPEDLSKPMASRLTTLDGIGNNVMGYDNTFACIAAFANLQDSVDIYKGSGRKTLGVAVDIAEYSLDGSGTSLSADFTGGAGAVAFTVGEGELLEVGESGEYTSHQYDFFKPKIGTSVNGNSREKNFEETLNFTQFPTVFGSFSELTYFKQIGEAYRNLKEKTKSNLSDFKLVAFHLPYPGITKHAFRYIQAIDEGTDKLITDLLDGLKPLDSFENEVELDWYLNEEIEPLRKHIKRSLKNQFSKPEDAELYQSLVEPTISYSSEIGNMYTGSIFLSLASGLVNGNYDAGDKILAIGYGSGASAIATEMTTTTKTRDIANSWNIGEQLSSRIAITADEYLSYRAGESSNSTVLGDWALNRVLDRGIPCYSKI